MGEVASKIKLTLHKSERKLGLGLFSLDFAYFENVFASSRVKSWRSQPRILDILPLGLFP